MIIFLIRLIFLNWHLASEILAFFSPCPPLVRSSVCRTFVHRSRSSKILSPNCRIAGGCLPVGKESRIGSTVPYERDANHLLIFIWRRNWLILEVVWKLVTRFLPSRLDKEPVVWSAKCMYIANWIYLDLPSANHEQPLEASYSWPMKWCDCGVRVPLNFLRTHAQGQTIPAAFMFWLCLDIFGTVGWKLTGLLTLPPTYWWMVKPDKHHAKSTAKTTPAKSEVWRRDGRFYGESCVPTCQLQAVLSHHWLWQQFPTYRIANRLASKMDQGCELPCECRTAWCWGFKVQRARVWYDMDMRICVKYYALKNHDNGHSRAMQLMYGALINTHTYIYIHSNIQYTI